MKSKEKISERYSHELQDIANRLNDLENGRIYEISRAKMDGYLATNIINLKKELQSLFYKIDNDLESTKEKFGRLVSEMQDK